MVTTLASVCWVLVANLLFSDATTPVRDGCRNLLQDIAGRGYADVELAAYCRASLPPQVCRDAFQSLGNQPWAPERIGAACQKWEDDAHAAAAPGREAVSYEDYVELQRRVDQCMQHKADAGLCKDPSSGSAIPLDKCIEWKLKEYPKYSQKVQDAIQKIFATATTGQVQSKAEVVGPVLTNSPNLSIFAGAAAFAVLLAGVSVAAVRRLQQGTSRPEHKHTLVSAGPESAAQDGA